MIFLIDEVISSLNAIGSFISTGFMATYLSAADLRDSAKDLEHDKLNKNWYSEYLEKESYINTLKTKITSGIKLINLYDHHMQIVMDFINEEYQKIQAKFRDSSEFVNPLLEDNFKNKSREFTINDSFYYQYSGKIKHLSNKFNNYKILKPGEVFNEKRILGWLNQFELYDKIGDGFEKKRLALVLLDKIDYHHYTHFQIMSKRWWENLSIDKKRNTIITLFGKLGSSSSIVTNIFLKCCRLDNKLLKDIPEIQQDSLKEALAYIEHCDKNILFIDDIIASGTQSVRLFSEWLGLNKGPLKEISPDDQLSEREKNILKTKKVLILVLIGLEDGLRELESFFKDNGYNINLIIFERKPLKKAFDSSSNDIFADERDLYKTRNMVKEIGYQILEEEAKKRNWLPAEQELHSLGFGDYEQLIVFDHGPPKITLPILWKKGTYMGHEWEPLFPRPEEI